MTRQYKFKPLDTKDLDLLSVWLRAPDVAVWYEDEDYIEDLEDHLDDARICQRLVLLDGAPFAYVQDYDIHGWADHHLAFLPKGSRGLDTFIGEPAMLGQGHGAKYLSAARDMAFASDVPALGIDPDPANLRAIGAYQKIGFAGTNTLETEWGAVRLMSLCNPALS